MTNAVVLCADDYGLTPGISRASIDLATQGRISALSCMTGSGYWREHAAWLKPCVGQIDIGLHITLVDEAPIIAMPNTAPAGRLPSISGLILKSYAGLIDRAEIEREITAQFDAFESAMGRPPDHIDGHLHTHVLPGVRDIVLAVAARRAPHAWLRNVTEPIGRILQRGVAVPKTAFIAGLGRGFANQARQPMNDGFSGVYGLGGDEDIAALFAHFLNTTAKRHVILCHPGDCADEGVACKDARLNEYQFLRSQNFLDLLAHKNIAVRRFSALAG